MCCPDEKLGILLTSSFWDVSFFAGYSEHTALALKSLVLIAEVLYSYFLGQLKLCWNQGIDPNCAIVTALGETLQILGAAVSSGQLPFC